MAKAITNNANANANTSGGGDATYTEAEIQISKYAARLTQMKHIDAKDLALNYIFPLLTRLAKESGDHAELIADLTEAVAEDGFDFDALAETFENALGTIVKLAQLLDETMVTAGFYTVSKNGLVATDKLPTNLRESYEAVGAQGLDAVRDIQEAMQAIEERGDDADDAVADADDEADDEAADAAAEAIAKAIAGPDGEVVVFERPATVTTATETPIVPAIAQAIESKVAGKEEGPNNAA